MVYGRMAMRNMTQTTRCGLVGDESCLRRVRAHTCENAACYIHAGKL